MRTGIQKNNTDSSPGTSLDGSFRKLGSASARSKSRPSSKFVPTSKTVHKLLKEYSTKLLDLNIFTEHLQDWVTENLYSEGPHNFASPFSLNELRTFDFALEGVLFQQLIRMPCPPHHPSDNNLKEDEFLALEDFLHTAAQGLWQTFWHKNKPLPFFLSYPRYIGSKFYTIEKAKSRGRLGGLCGAAWTSKSKARWDDVVEFVLFKQNLDENALSPKVICEALFYGVHMLFSRSLSGYKSVEETDYVFVSILDSKYGGVVRIGGDLGKLEVDLSDPYKSMAEWITRHADVSVSCVDRIWNGMGNVNWGDLGTLQVLLAMYYSIARWCGPARKSMDSLAEHHSIRLEKRRMETQLVEYENENENENALVPYSSNYNGEIVEVEYENNRDSKSKGARLNLVRGEMLVVEDRNEGLKSFRVEEVVNDGGGNSNFSYIAVAADSCTAEVLNLFVGAHSSRLEPSWEDMNLWYQVQRQTKVLNILKENGVSSKCLPEIIASGRVVHAGPCDKKGPNGVCDHPWCGTPVLATRPVGDPVSCVVGPFSSDEATRLCRDCLAGLRSAKTLNILHGDIRPENVIRVDESGFVLVSWGRAVLEDRDSPSLNLRFSSTHALQHGKLCPSSDIESLVYLVYFVVGGSMKEQDSIESALRWRKRCWEKRAIQRKLGQVSPILKAFADYVDSVRGTTYAVDYDAWLRRLNRAVDGSDDERGKMVEEGVRVMCVAESSGTSGGGNSL
ncbi:hypothetical protein ABFS82_12G037100 [Erythranthe guttata]|nr:PREDICTED: uncharacterized protein LOC105964477 isoform X1 [Erythranthe guttata]|eukprot:XP_012844436.1 PREDICTED: uncharacterized protein LOC105964477 isoform X1 [Erythranthe guttata]